ncbi:hypothetical protein BB561_000677 [Smittium simulii]|uniref:Uncharacterized protein n=1 Tax=Smittium simulii TaxID=133385 RepID=A0A2T9YY59_9FUNG|nr:hypothetical protein BB561_000677 [Smittium simulii]
MDDNNILSLPGTSSIPEAIKNDESNSNLSQNQLITIKIEPPEQPESLELQDKHLNVAQTEQPTHLDQTQPSEFSEQNQTTQKQVHFEKTESSKQFDQLEQPKIQSADNSQTVINDSKPLDLPILTKTKIMQAQALLTKQRKLFDKIDNILINKVSVSDFSTLEKGSEDGALSLTGDEDDATKITVSALNAGVQNSQQRILFLNSAGFKANITEKDSALAADLLNKLNFFLFQVSNYAASNSIIFEIKNNIKSSLKNSDVNTDKSPKFKSISKPSNILSSSGLDSGSSKHDFPSNSTPVYLSGPISQVITNNSRQKPHVESNNGLRILSKRKIQELVSEIDPNERIEPEVEDVRV